VIVPGIWDDTTEQIFPDHRQCEIKSSRLLAQYSSIECADAVNSAAINPTAVQYSVVRRQDVLAFRVLTQCLPTRKSNWGGVA
jgi:hypothetical protein